MFLHNRAWIRVQLGQTPEAVAPDLLRATAIDGGSVCHRVSLGLLLEQQDRTSEASDQYAAVLAISPETSDSEFARDMRRRDARLWDLTLSKAIAILRSRDPGSQDIATSARLARLYFEQGQEESARAMLETVTNAVPQFPRAWANLGRVCFVGGDFDRAETNLRRAAFLDGGDPIVPMLLSRIAQARGDEQVAAALRNRAFIASEQQWPPRALRVNRIYKTNAVVRDEVLPPGLLAYCMPSVGDDAVPPLRDGQP